LPRCVIAAGRGIWRTGLAVTQDGGAGVRPRPLRLFWPVFGSTTGGPFTAPTPPGGWEEGAPVDPTCHLFGGAAVAMIARHTKGAMLEVMHSDYVRTAESKGLDERRIATHHIFRNGLVPLVTIAGPLLAVLVTGSVVVERVFQIPGLGLLYWGAIRARDFGLLMGITVIYAAAIAIINALVDISYGWIDPRIRLTGTNDG
jgi:ABC-type microcin C transport system permease subunit YejB